jgi:hypothetical protein
MSIFSKNKYNPIVNSSKTYRDFSYSKNDIVLNFKLRIDIKTDLQVFKELLTQALEDIEGELNK